MLDWVLKLHIKSRDAYALLLRDRTTGVNQYISDQERAEEAKLYELFTKREGLREGTSNGHLME